MSGIRSDITGWFIGADKTFEWTVRQNDNRTVQNVTGWTLAWEIRTTITAGVTTLTKAGTVFDGPNGKVRVVIARADTTALSPATYQYALARTDAGTWDILAYGDAPLNAAAAK